MKTLLFTLAASLALHAAAGAEAIEAPGPYDEAALGATQVTEALARARPTGRRVLLVFGANWCADCRAMDALFKSSAEISAQLAAGYELVRIDVGRDEVPRKNAALIERFRVALETGIPVLVVADANGKPLTDTKKERLADTDQRDPAKVLRFLKQWAKQ